MPLSPVGARSTLYVSKVPLIASFAAFLLFAGWMMLSYRGKPRAISPKSHLSAAA